MKNGNEIAKVLKFVLDFDESFLVKVRLRHKNSSKLFKYMYNFIY